MIPASNPIGRARRALIEVFRRNDRLRHVKVWRLLDGARDDLGEPGDKLLPMVRFWSYPEKSNYYASTGGVPSHETPWILAIETVVAGADDYASLDLFDRMWSALYPEDPTQGGLVYSQLLAAGICGREVVEPWWGGPEIPGTLMRRSVGRIRVTQYLQSRSGG